MTAVVRSQTKKDSAENAEVDYLPSFQRSSPSSDYRIRIAPIPKQSSCSSDPHRWHLPASRWTGSSKWAVEARAVCVPDPIICPCLEIMSTIAPEPKARGECAVLKTAAYQVPFEMTWKTRMLLREPFWTWEKNAKVDLVPLDEAAHEEGLIQKSETPAIICERRRPISTPIDQRRLV